MKFYRIVAFLVVVLLSSGCGPQPVTSLGVKLEKIADGFTSPVALIDPADGSQRIFIVDQTGLIWILSGGKSLEKPILDLRQKVVDLYSFYEERGLLGLAFHPDFAANSRFYVSYSGQLRIGLSPDRGSH